jgi:hypothetical protein
VLVAVQRKDLGEREVGRLLDAPIELDEANVEPAGELPSDRRLAGAAQAEERDDARGVGSPSLTSSAAKLERAREIVEPLDRDVAGAGFHWTRKRTERPDRSASSRMVQRRAARACAHAAPRSRECCRPCVGPVQGEGAVYTENPG